MRNVDVIRELYRCFRERDDEGFRRICVDDVEWIQNVGFLHGAVRVGADAVIEGSSVATVASGTDLPITSRNCLMPAHRWWSSAGTKAVITSPRSRCRPPRRMCTI
jgi:hypothetical protein